MDRQAVEWGVDSEDSAEEGWTPELAQKIIERYDKKAILKRKSAERINRLMYIAKRKKL